MGIALELYNHVTVAPTKGSKAIAERPCDARAAAMVAEAASVFARLIRRKAGFTYRIEGDVPAARGLGSSVTVIAGVLAGLGRLFDRPLGPEKLVELVSGIEGHPDNAAAAVLGGFCVARSRPSDGAYLAAQRFRVPRSVAFVVVSPPGELMTKESRGALPPTLPFFDAVKSINSAAYLVAAFASGDYARLGEVSGDFIHEPYRLPRIPGGGAAIAAGIGAGAWTGWLSGSGSSVLCVCARPRSAAVLREMTRAFSVASSKCEGRILAADNRRLVAGAREPRRAV